MAAILSILLPMLFGLSIIALLITGIALVGVLLRQLSGAAGKPWPWREVELISRCAILAICACWISVFANSAYDLQLGLHNGNALIVSLILTTISASWLVVFYSQFQSDQYDGRFLSLGLLNASLVRMSIAGQITALLAVLLLTFPVFSQFELLAKLRMRQAFPEFCYLLVYCVATLFILQLVISTSWVRHRLEQQRAMG